MTDSALVLCLILTLVAPLAAIGMALINTGLGRTRNASHSMLAALLVLAVAAVMYSVFGFAWQGYAGKLSFTFFFRGAKWGLIGCERPLLDSAFFDGSARSLAALLGIFAAGLASVIPLGSGGDRWRLGASCFSTALLAGVTFPLFAHWAWGGGWLAQLGSNYGLGRGFIDSGGSAAIHAVGGLTALSIAWLLGPRRGKYTREGMPIAIPGHNAVFFLAGCLLALPGWIALNCAGAMLFSGAEPGKVPLIAVNTVLSGAAALLASAAITRSRFGKTDASLCANGWIGGLVASSAGCAVMRPAAAALIGVIAAGLVIYSVEWLELHLTVDDPGGAVSVHAVGGLWGVLAAGIGGADGQWLAQLAGFATLIGFVLPLTYGLNWLLDRLHRLRVAAEGERQGLDLFELGAGAYPDLHNPNDEYWQR